MNMINLPSSVYTREQPNQSTVSTVRAFRPDVEGLRALAVIFVILNHAGLSFLQGGFTGVDIFLVLSGFLITGLLLKEHEQMGNISIVGFYARRARRILPASTLVLAITIIATALLIGGTRAARIAEDAQWTALFASNIRFIQQGTNYWSSTLPPSPLQHYWSLAVEEQFYFIWPACLIGLSVIAEGLNLRTKMFIVLSFIIIASFSWSIYATNSNATEAYFSPFPRTFELAVGALLAVLAPWIIRLPRRVGVLMSILGLAAIVASGALLSADTAFPGYAVILPVGGAVLAVAGGTIAPGGGSEILLSLPPLQWIGKLSYSLYLWHWPVLVLAPGLLGKDLSVPENLLVCVAAVILSIASFQLVESPVRNSNWLKAHSPLFSIAIGLCLVAFSVGLASELKSNLPATIDTGQYIFGSK